MANTKVEKHNLTDLNLIENIGLIKLDTHYRVPLEQGLTLGKITDFRDKQINVL